MATTARDYGHPDGPAGPVWAPLTRDPDTVQRVRLPNLRDAAVTHEPAGVDAMSLLTEWMDDDSAEMVVLDDEIEEEKDEPWSA